MGTVKMTAWLTDWILLSLSCVSTLATPTTVTRGKEANFSPIVFLLPKSYEEMFAQPQDVSLEASLGEEILSPGTDMRRTRSKRNPGCVKKCLLSGTLHPDQCHYLC